MEIISPAGFEHDFGELAAGVGSPEEYRARYGSQVDLGRTRRPCEQHGLGVPDQCVTSPPTAMMADDQPEVSTMPVSSRWWRRWDSNTLP